MKPTDFVHTVVMCSTIHSTAASTLIVAPKRVTIIDVLWTATEDSVVRIVIRLGHVLWHVIETDVRRFATLGNAV